MLNENRFLGTFRGHNKRPIMSELLENLVPGTLPHYFVILTLANFAQADGKSKEKYYLFVHLFTLQPYKSTIKLLQTNVLKRN
jgi:hypothetical protein